MARFIPRARARPRALVLLGALTALVAPWAAAGPGGAASSSTVVGATVPSATSVDAAACATGVDDVTEFGIVLPGSGATTGTDCTVTFGSSNDTAQLRLYQRDGDGTAMAAPGTGELDDTFSGDGTALVDLSGIWLSDTPGDIVVDPLRGPIVVGESNSNDPVVARLDMAGGLDPTFTGPTGTASGVVNLGTGGALHDAALLDDGRILAVGEDSGADAACTVVRLTTTGDYDDTFDGDSGTADGMVSIQLGSNDDECVGIEVLEDGRLAIAANAATDTESSAHVIVLESDGRLDTDFAGGGVLTLPVGASWDSATDIESAPNGDLVVGGDRFDGIFGSDSWVARLDDAGTLRPAFGSSGIQTFDEASDEAVRAVAVQADGKVLVAGTFGGLQGDVGVIRLDAVTGAYDPSFGAGGIYLEHFGNNGDAAQDIAVWPDGSIYVVGIAWGAARDLFVVKVRSNGTRDSSFYSEPAAAWGGVALEITDDGRIWALGMGNEGTGNDAAIVRFSALAIDDYAAAAADWSTTSTSMFAACLRDVSGGAATGAGTWTRDVAGTAGDCDGVDTDPWHAIPAANGDPTAKVAQTTVTGTTGATVLLRFGLRVAADQAPGYYAAPVVFETLAPAA